MTEGARQLPLGVHLRDEATFDNFLFSDDMGVLREALNHPVDEGGEHFIYLHGPAGSGRSHLLQAACHFQPVGEALYLPLEQLVQMPAAELLDSIDQLSLVCLDQLDAITGNRQWEEALFNLCNRARQGHCRLLFSASEAPRHLPFELADLQSRLAWGLVLQVPDPSDPFKLEILRYRAARRGLELPEEVARFILHRSARSLVALIAVLEQLDRASLIHQRQLSIPFVKASMGW